MQRVGETKFWGWRNTGNPLNLKMRELKSLLHKMKWFVQRQGHLVLETPWLIVLQLVVLIVVLMMVLTVLLIAKTTEYLCVPATILSALSVSTNLIQVMFFSPLKWYFRTWRYRGRRVLVPCPKSSQEVVELRLQCHSWAPELVLLISQFLTALQSSDSWSSALVLGLGMSARWVTLNEGVTWQNWNLRLLVWLQKWRRESR